MEKNQLDLRIDEITEKFKTELLKNAAKWAQARTPSDLFDFEQQLQVSMNILHTNILGGILEEIHRDKEFVARCECDAQVGHKLPHKGLRTVSVRSLNGRKTKIRTPYLSHPEASRTSKRGEPREGVYPVLRRLGVIRGSTPRFLAEINRQMADGPSTAEALERLASREIHFSKKKMQNTLRDFGSIALWQREVAMRGLAKIKPPEKGRLHGKRVVLGLDGGRIRIRVNRIQDDQTVSKTYTTDKCEPKLFAIYCIDEKGEKERREDIIYDGTIQSADYLFELLQLRLKQLGIHKAQLLAVIGDGAPWIWNGVTNLRRSLRLGKLRIIEIVDWAHAVGKLSEAAKVGIRARAQQQPWFRRARRMLKNGDLNGLKKAFSELNRRQDKENCIAKTKDYFETHRKRMQYPKFKKEGLPIGSGIVESGIRRIINLRLSGASIFWLPEVAEQILYLRCQVKSGQWSNFVKSTLGQWALEMKSSLKTVYEIDKQIAADFHESHPPQYVSHTRPEIIKWAQRLMGHENVLILDTETTGLNEDDEIIQVAVVNLRGETHFHTFLRPLTGISDEAFAVHGITSKGLVDAPGFGDVYEILREILHDREVVAYNAEFDKRMIDQTCRKNGLTPIDRVTWHCLMEKYSFFYGRRRRDGTYIPQTLKSACEQQRLSVKESHEAVKDCLAALELIRAIVAADPS